MGILAAMELQSQYEKLLAEFAEFLETAQSKLTGEETPSTLNLHDLRQQLDAHKVSIVISMYNKSLYAPVHIIC